MISHCVQLYSLVPPPLGNTLTFDLGEDEASEPELEEDEYEDEGVDEYTPPPTPVIFEDITARLSSVHSDVPPSQLLAQGSNHTTLTKAIRDNDLEAVVQVADLMKLLEEPIIPNRADLEVAIDADSPAIVDELIRRTGLGISFGIAADIKSSPYKDADSETGFYLGLDVGGKKRRDLARCGDPDAPSADPDVPLLWMAAEAGAVKCIEYLSGSGPLSAYSLYMANHDNERTRALGLVTDLAVELPKLLGFTHNSYNVTPILKALAGKKQYSISLGDRPKAQEKLLVILKALVAATPELAPRYMDARTRWFGITPLMVACGIDAGASCFDYLLANGALPDARDNRG